MFSCCISLPFILFTFGGFAFLPCAWLKPVASLIPTETVALLLGCVGVYVSLAWRSLERGDRRVVVACQSSLQQE